jgi:hypothetical protein
LSETSPKLNLLQLQKHQREKYADAGSAWAMRQMILRKIISGEVHVPALSQPTKHAFSNGSQIRKLLHPAR